MLQRPQAIDRDPQDMTEPVISNADLDEIRALFLRQAAGESSQNIEAVDAVLARAAPGQPDPVAFVARAYRFWGREAVLDHFRTVFKGTWRFEPDLSSLRITPISADTAHIYAPTLITLGPAGGPAATYAFLVNEFAVRTQEGWRIATIVPVPAQ
jgi:ketosteroid isomerase-like protein